jgi:uncharacterized protein
MDAKLLQILDHCQQNYPHQLEQQFPRVLQKIIELWDQQALDDYFNDLLVSKRSHRQGFPPQVASDIMYLSRVYTRLQSPQQEGIWSEVLESNKQEIERLGVSYSREGLIKACESGKEGAVILFMKSGMNVNTCDERQWTPLMISAYNGNQELATLLINHGADIRHKDKGGYTPLHWASFNGYLSVVRLLLDSNAEVDALSKHGWTALLQAATRGHLSVSQALIEKGADVNAVSNDGWTPLLKAAANGHLAEVKLLVSKGADVDAKYGDSVTAMDLAKKNKHEEIIAALSGKD